MNKMTIVAILVNRFLVKQRFPAKTSISTNQNAQGKKFDFQENRCLSDCQKQLTTNDTEFAPIFFLFPVQTH